MAKHGLILLLILLIPGCAVLPKKKPVPPEPVAPATALPAAEKRKIGEVVLVNREKNFVLIELTPGLNLRTGTQLQAGSLESDNAILQVGAERRRPFLVAEIIQGEPAPGMEVFE